MKKEYIKPEMVVEEFLIQDALLVITSNQGVEDEEKDDFANKRREGRGTWGNLWDQGED